MRDAKGRQLQWLGTILATRDMIEFVIRGISARTRVTGYTTKQVLGTCPVVAAHRWLVDYYAPAHLWDDPIF